MRIESSIFGTLEVERDKIDNIYYLSLKENNSSLNADVIFSFASRDRQLSNSQIQLYRSIADQLGYLVNSAYSRIRGLYRETKSNLLEDIIDMYKIESINIPTLDEENPIWEIDFRNTVDGFSHCIVEFKDSTPIAVSTQA